MSAYVEVALSWIFANAKGHDAMAFPTTKGFESHPKPTIPLTSPDCGEHGSTLAPEYIFEGGGKLPTLTWDASGVSGKVEEWLLFSEDPDAPLKTPICHGIYMGVPKDKNEFSPTDLERASPDSNRLKSGIYYGMNLRSMVYIPPKPLLNHGIHRYFFYIIALSEPLDKPFMAKTPTREQVAEAIEGKVLGWGEWMAKCERRWT